MTPATVTKTIIGRSVNFTAGATKTFPVSVNGTAQNITVTTTAANTFNIAGGAATFLWVDDTGGKGHLQITVTGDSTALTFENNNNAEAVGLKTADILAYVKDEDLILETTDGQVLDVALQGPRLCQACHLKTSSLPIYLLRTDSNSKWRRGKKNSS